jgi:dihydrofolate reductase
MPTNVIWHVTMSVDGFIAGPADEMEWGFRYGKPGPMGNEVIARTGAILAGRRGFDLGTKPGRQGRGIYGGAWSGPMFVLTHHPDDAPEMPGVSYLSGGIEDAVTTARAAAGEKGLGIFGASIARQCLERDLLDEIFIHLVPTLLGEGIRFYDANGHREVRLERTGLWDAGQITDLRFRVIR